LITISMKGKRVNDRY